MIVFHNEDGNPARANIKQALGYLKDGDGDGIPSVKASANSDVMYSFTSAQDGDPLQDDCMTRSSTNELFTPYKEPEREFRSSRRHFKTLSLDELRSPDFNLLSDQEYSEEEEAEAMTETMEQYMSKT
ncbi:hypothetical protein Tco_1155382 [Tanacetum coccineum]